LGPLRILIVDEFWIWSLTGCHIVSPLACWRVSG
jgi:hypothetical protein